MNFKRYRQFPPVNLPNRQWPNKVIEKHLFGVVLTLEMVIRHLKSQ